MGSWVPYRKPTAVAPMCSWAEEYVMCWTRASLFLLLPHCCITRPCLTCVESLFSVQCSDAFSVKDLEYCSFTFLCSICYIAATPLVKIKRNMPVCKNMKDPKVSMWNYTFKVCNVAVSSGQRGERKYLRVGYTTVRQNTWNNKSIRHLSVKLKRNQIFTSPLECLDLTVKALTDMTRMEKRLEVKNEWQ